VNNRLDNLLSLVIATAALGMAGSFIFTSISGRGGRSRQNPGKVSQVDDWREFLPSTHHLAGSSTAPVIMIVFGDLECPACRGYHSTVVKRAIASHAQDLSIEFAHFPLSMHRFAMPAARVTECVANLGALSKWIDVVYQKQDSLGLKSWGSFAAEAGVSDTLSLNSCAASSSEVANITAGVKYGNKLKIGGTPSVLLDGWLYPNPPSSEVIDSVLKSRGKVR